MQLVDNDTFLERLAELIESTKDRGTVWLTHKRLRYDGEDALMAHGDEDRSGASSSSSDTREYPCLLRLTDGKKTKISTKITSAALPKFHAAYGALLKSSLGATLRKRDKKREKLKADEAAKRRRRMLEPVVVDGPKRGKGRRSRQRKVKAALKQQASQAKAKEREEEEKRKTAQSAMAGEVAS